MAKFDIPTKKLKSGFELPVFGIGTWEMGGKRERDIDNDDTRDISAIQKAIELGVTHIDTAEGYAAGHAEFLVGQAIKNFDRSKLFIVSKVKKENLKYEDVLTSFNQSLKRLGVDYLDLYLIHSPHPELPIADTLRAMDKLIEEGILRNIGVSNFKTKRLIEAQKHTKNKLAVNQVYYNLAMREPESEGLLTHCQHHDVLLEAYRPIEKGKLLDNPLLQVMANKYNKTPAQVAINWLISQDSVVTIAKAANITHLEENLGALGWHLKAEDIETLRTDFPDQQHQPQDLPLK